VRARGDEGQIGGLEAVIFGVLIFVIGTLVVVNAWGVIDAKTAAAGAAREGTRAFVESRAPDAGGASAEAKQAAMDSIAGSGRNPARMLFDDGGAQLRRCERVTITVSYPVPIITVPLLGRYGTAMVASARYSEIVDPYRSGLGRDTACVWPGGP
jgi:hypothetical protein